MNPDKYKSIGNGFAVTVREDGFRGLAKGWAPTFIGYSMQGLCKFGFYEVFKIFYSDLLGEVSSARLLGLSFLLRVKRSLLKPTTATTAFPVGSEDWILTVEVKRLDVQAGGSSVPVLPVSLTGPQWKTYKINI